MKYVLVDSHDYINTKVELASDVGISGATTYFKGVKRMPKDEDFNKLWRVMTEDQYLTQYTASLQDKQYEWWKEEKEITDSELKY
tara:strand:+ start:92 stop:346 length:255 start_codon:yes stop_codon:yes gene_type:complete